MEWDEKRFLLGIDAGATKTHYALYDRRERTLEVLTGGPANHESLVGGFEELETVLGEMVGALLNHFGIKAYQVDGAGFGMAGVDTRRQHAIVSDIFRRLGLPCFAMSNDASLGIWATCPDGAGVCAVNGSGFSVYAMDGVGGEIQIGGLGDLTGDKGGGGYLSDKAIAGVYASLYKGGPATAMAGPMFASLGVARKEEFVEALSDGLYGSKGDCTLAIDTLADEVTNAMQPVDCVFHRLTAPPVLGALQWAQVTAGMPPMNDEERQHLIRKLASL